MNELEKYFEQTDGVASFLSPTFLVDGQIQFNVFTSPYQLGNFSYNLLENYLQNIEVGLSIAKFIKEINISQRDKKQNYLQLIVCNKLTYIEITEHNSDLFNEYMDIDEFKLFFRFVIDSSIPNNKFVLQSLSTKLDNKFPLVKIENGRFALHPNITNEAKWINLV